MQRALRERVRRLSSWSRSVTSLSRFPTRIADSNQHFSSTQLNTDRFSSSNDQRSNIFDNSETYRDERDNKQQTTASTQKKNIAPANQSDHHSGFILFLCELHFRSLWVSCFLCHFAFIFRVSFPYGRHAHCLRFVHQGWTATVRRGLWWQTCTGVTHWCKQIGTDFFQFLAVRVFVFLVEEKGCLSGHLRCRSCILSTGSVGNTFLRAAAAKRGTVTLSSQNPIHDK